MRSYGASNTFQGLFCAIVLLLWLFTASPVNAQIVSFSRIDQSDGLRNANVRAIIKDYQGFMWFGTEDGLARYDGSSMKIYRKSEDDTTSISSNFILCLFEDSEQNLWIGTLDGGLCLYDRAHDTFVRFRSRGPEVGEVVDDAVRVIYENNNKELFLGAGQLLQTRVTANAKATVFSRISLPVQEAENAGVRIMDINNLSDSVLLIAVNNLGLYLYNTKTKQFSEHRISEIEKNIQSFHLDRRRNLLWLGTWKHGLLASNLSGTTYRWIQQGESAGTLRNNFVPKIIADSSGNLWVGTDHGLSMIPRSCDPFHAPIVDTYLPDPQNPSSIQGTIIKTLYIDRDDNLWAGVYYNGVSLYHKRGTHFGTITFSLERGTQTLGFPSVTAVVEDRSQGLWLGTDGSGLYHSRDPITDKAPTFQKISSCAGIEKIKTMKPDSAGNLWIGTWGKGLYVFNTVTRQCKNFDAYKTGTDIGTEIISLEVDSSGDVWIGTFDDGLFRFSPAQNQVVHIDGRQKRSNFVDRVNTIQIGKNDDVWIGKERGGLNRSRVGAALFDVVETEHVEASTSVTSVYVESADIVWVGCQSKGLVRVDLKDNTSTLYSENDGLSNSMIYAILGDTQNRLWISSDAGLSLFDKDTKKFFNFGLANGLLSSQFNRGSALASRNGLLIFGNIKGANYINPKTLSFADRRNKIVFTKLFVNNREQLVGNRGSVLPQNIAITRRIMLNHDQNSFSVEVSPLNFDFSFKPEYYYKLEGFNDGWQYGGTQQLIQYTNLEPDTYTLMVSTSQPGSTNDPSLAAIEIVIRPAWWQTIFFRAFVIVALASIAFATHRIRVRYLLYQKARLEAQVNQRTLKLNEANDLLKSKLNEINSINELLQQHQYAIVEKNNEIQAQNEELTAQNEQIAQQHEIVVNAQLQLQEINQKLERTVDERTVVLQKTIDDLNKIVFELDRFVYSASHDLSAPLKSILGLVHLIKLETERTKIIDHAGLIRESVLKLEAVIKSMVDYARNSHLQVATETFNLRKLIDEVFFDLAFLPGAQQLSFENQVPDGLFIQNDASRVKVILHNLIGNGIKYVDKSKDGNFIRVTASKDETKTTFNVIDNGIGIRKEFLDKIFNMYFRGTEVSKGSGLGLFIVKETTLKIGGTISVQSTIGKGTNFEVTIPEISVL